MVVILPLATGIPAFFPFGGANGDSRLPTNDDGFQQIGLAVPFPFFDVDQNTVFVDNNGLLSFRTGISQYINAPFPGAAALAGSPIVAAYWTDFDTRGSVTTAPADVALGVLPQSVYYRVSYNASDAAFALVAGTVAASLPGEQPFTPTMVGTFTWWRVGYYPAKVDYLSTMQCMLATDGDRSFALMLYDSLPFSTNPNWLVPAQAGFNAGDNRTFYNIPGSYTADVSSLVNTSNVGTPGLWVFRVDTAITAAGCGAGSVGGLSPSRGSLFGGTIVAVNGPCLTPGASILCKWGGNASTPALLSGGGGGVNASQPDGGVLVEGLYLSSLSAACAAPFSLSLGPVPVFVSATGGANWTAVGDYHYVAPDTPGE